MGRINKFLAGLLLFLVAVLGIQTCHGERQARISAEARVDTLLILNDSTQARLAQARLERDQLQALRQAGQDLDGELVAGVKMRVERDTIYLPVTTAPTRFEGETRYATLEDSTEGYRIRVSATAPPFPDSLQIGYEIQTPEFTPEVGFVRRGEDYYAVVSWAGKEVETSEAFFRPAKERALSLHVGVQVDGYPTDTQQGLRLSGRPFVALQHSPNPRTHVQFRVSYEGKPSLGVVATRKVW